jgi:hypothetical protein
MRMIRGLVLCGALALLCGHGRAQEQPLSFGESAVSLNGPWAFQVGDDPHWADPDFNDSRWESVDLTPKPGAHDGDVGLRDYVAGWAARGHRGYVGTAWYRLKVQVRDAGQQSLWLAGPAAVDHVYQLYVNGRLVGGIGDFTHTPPTVVAIRPRLFELPRSLWTASDSNLGAAIAFRVTLIGGPGAAGADRGGIHIAPVLGTEQGALGRYRFEWDQKLAGYVVDALEAAVFLGLGVMALCLIPFEPSDRFHPWMAASLLLMCATRGNQPLFWLTETETLREFLLWRLTVADALLFACWAMAWCAAFYFERPRWFARACLALTLIYLIARPLSSPVILASSPIVVMTWVTNATRLGFLGLLIIVLVGGVRAGRRAVLPVLALLFGSVALFSQELSALGVPGIWFPYGVGVSRTEYAYAAFELAIFFYLMKRPRESWRNVGSLVLAAAR